jgi:hypothetical protein
MAKSKRPDDLAILDDLVDIFYGAIKKNESLPKVGDFLKVIELKQKLAVTGTGEEKFWAMVNRLRNEELSENGGSRPTSKIAHRKRRGNAGRDGSCQGMSDQ